MTQRHANTWMTLDEQVAFAWKHREHFAKVMEANLARHHAPAGEVRPLRNAWIELADEPDAKPEQTGQMDMFGEAA